MPEEKISFDYPSPKTLRIKFSQDWQMTTGFPEVGEITRLLAEHQDVTELKFDASEISKWDSGFVSFLFHLAKECKEKSIQINQQGLPEGAQKLLALALGESKKNTAPHPPVEPFLEKIADKALEAYAYTLSLLNLLGEIVIGSLHLFRGKSYFRQDEFIYVVQKCGVSALPLVSLISILVGVILAFIGAIQLRLFGAQIYIADIVGIAMVRVMGAVMAGILMAGRTGASFAAELGIMQANEEIDALKTLGVSPVEFLVLPRLFALVMMMPLLALYADFMGILGGFAISVGLLGLNPIEYWSHTQSAVKMSNLWIGLAHSFVFAIIIAVAGCHRGIRCERSAAGVGEATTSAVVEAVTNIVIATAIITFICQVLGI